MSRAAASRPGVTDGYAGVDRPLEAVAAQRRWLILATVIAGTLMASLDATISLVQQHKGWHNESEERKEA